MMRRYVYRIVFFFVAIVVYGGCSRKTAPGTSEVVDVKGFDNAKFNYVYVEAIKQKLMGNNGEALKRLEEAIEINPESDAAYYQVAQIASSNGDIENGKRFLKKAIEIDPQNVWYLMMMGGFYYQQKNIDSAIICYENAVKYLPDEDDLQLTLGNLYSENKNYDKAIRIFDLFDKKYGVNENSTVSAIRALVNAGKYVDAQKKAEMLINEFPDEVLYNGLLAEIFVGKGEKDKARELYTNLLNKNPDDPRIQLAVCEFLVEEKDYKELFLLLNSVTLNSNIKKEDKISLLARIIEIPELVNNYSEQLVISLMILEANYKDEDIVPLLRPEVLIKMAKLDEASERLDEIIKEKPDNYYAWEKLLLVLNEKKDYKNLMIKGEECASRFNRSFLAKVLYALAALETKNFDVALEELRKAEILAGNNKEFLMQVLTMRADVYYRMKDYSKAFETLDQALRENGEDLTVINNYAYYLAEQDKNLKEAEEMARKVIDKEKGNTTFLDTYAWVLYKRGKLKDAARIMEEIINSGESPDAEWYEHYGYILSKQRNCSEATEKWNYAIKLDSTKTELKEEIKNCGR